MLYPDTIHNPKSPLFPDQTWKKPLGLAIALHLLVFVLAIMPPSFFGHRREIPEVVTINLFTATEIPEAKPAPKAPAKPKTPRRAKRQPPPPQPDKPVTSIAEEAPAPAPPPPTPGEVVSLKPRKMKKAPPKPEKKEKTLEDKRLEALQRVQAMVNKKQEEERLKHDLAKLRDTLHADKPSPEPAPAEPDPAPQPAEPGPAAEPAAPVAASGGPASSGAESVLLNLARNQYAMAINRKIQDHWILPEMQSWEASLEAILVIVVRRDGVVTKRFFEKKSNNIYFDQFVEKTVEEAFPLPPFPSAIKDKTMEFGLIFHPGGLF